MEMCAQLVLAVGRQKRQLMARLLKGAVTRGEGGKGGLRMAYPLFVQFP